jgi:hypothetical protein
VVSIAYICSIADRANKVFHERSLFLISHESRRSARAIRVNTLLAEA